MSWLGFPSLSVSISLCLFLIFREEKWQRERERVLYGFENWKETVGARAGNDRWPMGIEFDGGGFCLEGKYFSFSFS
jgi:hypothetical protein